MKKISNQREFENLDNFFETLIPSAIKIEFVLKVEVVTSNPRFLVTIDDCILFNDVLDEGLHNITLDTVKLEPGKKSVLTLSMSGKNKHDTICHNDVIVKDTFILIEKITINNFDILLDTDFFYRYFACTDNSTNESISVSNGFWSNSSLTMTFDNPFELWYNSKSTKNIELAGPLKFQNGLDRVEDELARLLDNLEKLDY
jgi:hypothetical protein